jgi:hypothetical protein
MSYSRILKAIPLVILTLLLWAALAHGQAPKKTSGGESGKPATAETAKQQLKPGLVSYSTATERKALREIRRRAQAEVRELSLSLSSLPDESDRRALQKRISEVKREAQLEHLRTKAYFALGRGDLQAAHEIDQIIERLLEPRFSVPVTPAGKDDFLPQKGGQP